MNQHQRKFLLDEIEKQYRREMDQLNSKRPKAPSLNNYLVAAILDGSIRMRKPADLADAVRRRVRDLGKGETFVTSERDRWGQRRMDDDDQRAEMVSIPALLLFEAPEAYAEQRKAYEVELEKWEAARAALDASIAAMRIKVQVGSDKALNALVEQADTLCSMSLTMSSRLLLAAPAATREET